MIPGNEDIPGNEEVDGEAKKGAQSGGTIGHTIPPHNEIGEERNYLRYHQEGVD